MAPSDDLQAFVDSREDLSFTSMGKVRCSISGHDMPATMEAVKAHLESKSYLKAKM